VDCITATNEQHKRPTMDLTVFPFDNLQRVVFLKSRYLCHSHNRISFQTRSRVHFQRWTDKIKRIHRRMEFWRGTGQSFGGPQHVQSICPSVHESGSHSTFELLAWIPLDDRARRFGSEVQNIRHHDQAPPFRISDSYHVGTNGRSHALGPAIKRALKKIPCSDQFLADLDGPPQSRCRVSHSVSAWAFRN